MKKLKFCIIPSLMSLFFLVAFNVATFANEVVPSITLKAANYGKKISLLLEDLNSETTVKLESKSGVVFLNEKIKDKTSFGKMLNLEFLPAGEYRIIIGTYTRETLQPFTITDNKVVLDKNLRTVTYNPVINLKGDFLDVSLMNNRLDKIAIVLMNNRGEVVFEEKVNYTLKVEKRYNVAQLIKGRYTLKVTNSAKTYYKDIEI